ncbi:Na/Pi cotransporter family protein [Crassaminicella profunda]|uniref:Na/Pi cotransporter family protein n=1 Tax=Crassaminicella profunda TaxID=1286698 RepID=UPI001CA64949|nr:Na/Pi symporter [Crassaminicella profunda]QZY56250.1 Na/Pi symporter [Crassaminicella profunda]
MLFSILIGTFLGVILFFIGMFLLTHSIKALYSKKLKKFIATLTIHPLLGIFSGIVITALMQSSSATSILVVSLVNSRVMNLYQAAFILMGANVGTTFTAQLISFDFFFLIPHILFLGVLLFFLRWNPLSKNIGKFLIAFSFLFLGIKLMVASLNPLKDLMHFKTLMLSIEHQHLKGIFIGAMTTAVIQSSSTSIATLQGLAHIGLIDIYQAVPIIMGQNIGTCVTTLFSSMATNKNGKRAAIIHLLFNVTGTIFLYPFIHLFSHFVFSLTPLNSIRQIANAHTLFNVFNVILLLPFVKLFVFTSKKIIR